MRLTLELLLYHNVNGRFSQLQFQVVFISGVNWLLRIYWNETDTVIVEEAYHLLDSFLFQLGNAALRDVQHVEKHETHELPHFPVVSVQKRVYHRVFPDYAIY